MRIKKIKLGLAIFFLVLDVLGLVAMIIGASIYHERLTVLGFAVFISCLFLPIICICLPIYDKNDHELLPEDEVAGDDIYLRLIIGTTNKMCEDLGIQPESGNSS